MPLTLTDSSSITFSVTADPASAQPGRFYIVFTQATVVPVKFITISASRNSESGIDIAWKVNTEIDVAHYQVERSLTGTNFESLPGVMPGGRNNFSTDYSSTDATPLTGANFYRIKAVNQDGTSTYSAIVKVADVKGLPGIMVKPNPVVDKNLQVSFSNQAAGIYKLRLINSLGQTVYVSTVSINNRNSSQSFVLGDEISPGVYQLQLNSGKVQSVQQVFIK